MLSQVIIYYYNSMKEKHMHAWLINAMIFNNMCIPFRYLHEKSGGELWVKRGFEGISGDLR